MVVASASCARMSGNGPKVMPVLPSPLGLSKEVIDAPQLHDDGVSKLCGF